MSDIFYPDKSRYPCTVYSIIEFNNCIDGPVSIIIIVRLYGLLYRWHKISHCSLCKCWLNKLVTPSLQLEVTCQNLPSMTPFAVQVFSCRSVPVFVNSISVDFVILYKKQSISSQHKYQQLEVVFSQ